MRLSAYSSTNKYAIKRNNVIIESDLKEQIYIDTVADYGTQYTYAVTYDIRSHTDTTCEAEVTNIEECSLPGPVDGLSYTSNTAGEVTLTWGAPSGGVTKYWYRIGLGSSFTDTTLLTVSATKSPSSFYLAEVYAQYDCSSSSAELEGPVESVVIYTKPDVVTVEALSYSSTQINVKVTTADDVDSISLYDETDTLIKSGLLKDATYFHHGLTPGQLN